MKLSVVAAWLARVPWTLWALAVLAWCATIYWGSSGSGGAGGFLSRIPHFDKVMHAGVYGGLGALCQLTLWARGLPRDGFWRGIVAFCATVLYGLSDELHQAWVPGRFPDPMDLLADAGGGLLGILSIARLCADLPEGPRKTPPSSEIPAPAE